VSPAGSDRAMSALEGALTPAELRVVLLVAEGSPNKEVAAALYVSRRTVESHLLCVYRKLGISSRSQLTRLFVLSERARAEDGQLPAMSGSAPG
jgi:DNA-binding CsgD family transcriptional regulator